MSEQSAAVESLTVAKLRMLTLAARDSRLGAPEVRLLAAALDYLCRREGPDYGTFWASMKTLADASASSSRAVARSLVRLVDCGYLDPLSTGGGRDRNGVGRANVYRLATLPEMATLADLADREGMETLPKVARLAMPEVATLPEVAGLSMPVLVNNPATFGQTTLPKVADNPLDSTLEKNLQTRARDALREFEEVFWPAYPLKNAPGAALRAWHVARGKASLDAIVAGLARYKTLKPDWQQWQHAGNWLTDERWRDAGEAAETSPASAETVIARRRKHALFAIPCGQHLLGPLEPTEPEIVALVRAGEIQISDAAKFCHVSVKAFADRWGMRVQGEIIMPLGKSA